MDQDPEAPLSVMRSFVQDCHRLVDNFTDVAKRQGAKDADCLVITDLHHQVDLLGEYLQRIDDESLEIDDQSMYTQEGFQMHFKRFEGFFTRSGRFLTRFKEELKDGAQREGAKAPDGEVITHLDEHICKLHEHLKRVIGPSDSHRAREPFLPVLSWFSFVMMFEGFVFKLGVFFMMIEEFFIRLEEVHLELSDQLRVRAAQ